MDLGQEGAGGRGGEEAGGGRLFLGFRDCKIMSFPDVQAA